MPSHANELDTRIRVVCISDTHDAQPPVPDGDILIHAGDLTDSGSADHIRATVEWLSSLPHPIKLVVAGNHDKALDIKFRERRRAPFDDPALDWDALGITYLEHSATKIVVRGRELNVFGSPCTPDFGQWAFQYPQAHLLPERAQAVWEAIPLDTDILITHGPPFAHMDEITPAGKLHGCRALLDRVWHVQPMLHVFGHIHESRGTETVHWDFGQRMNEVWIDGGKKLSGVLPRWCKLAGGIGLGGGKRSTLLVNAAIKPGGPSSTPLNKARVEYV